MTTTREEKALIISDLGKLGSLAEIFRSAERQGTAMQQRVERSRARTRKERNMLDHLGPIELDGFLRALVNILGYDGVAVAQLSAEDREIVRPLIEDLVAKGQMEPQRLNEFRPRKSPS